MSKITSDFITELKKLHHDVRTVLTELRLIGADVKLIREHRVSEPATPIANTQEHDSEHSPSENSSDTGGVTLKTKETQRDEDGSNNTQHGRIYRFFHGWWQAVKTPRMQLEIAALFGLFIYTYEAHQANKLGTKNFDFQFSMARQQQRSYMELVADKPPKLEDMKVRLLIVQLKNSGRVPANKVKYEFVLEFPQFSQQPSFNFGQLHSIGTMAPLPPSSAPIQIEVSNFDSDGRTILPLSDDLRNDLKSGERYVVMYGRVGYEDIFGQWWMQSCRWWSYAEIPLGKSKQFQAGSCIDFNVEGGTPKTQADDASQN